MKRWILEVFVQGLGIGVGFIAGIFALSYIVHLFENVL